MDGEAKARARAVADLLHYSNIPPFQDSFIGGFHHSIHGLGTVGNGRPIVQNKANFGAFT
jgi:hypothetical protein